VNPEVGNLRRRRMYAALREATLAVARRELHVKETGEFRIVHVSIQRTHVHLLVEADNQDALSRGMQSFQISAARHINGALGRSGNVFVDRFHQELLTCPRRARNALAYVINNWRKHREDRGDVERTWNVDPFSTGVLFDGWRERENEVLMWRWRATYDPLLVFRPRSWLLRKGWREGGPPVGFRETPGAL
jgi:REP element-mobilizing transposase RayT